MIIVMVTASFSSSLSSPRSIASHIQPLMIPGKCTVSIVLSAARVKSRSSTTLREANTMMSKSTP